MPWYKQKTTWTALAGVATALGAYVEGSLGFTGLISAVFGGMAVVCMRQGIEKSGPGKKTSERGEELK